VLRDFREKDIRKAIIDKAKPRKISKNSPHWKGKIYVGEVFVAKVKIPNDHPRIMRSSKLRFIARDLQLTEDQFNAFVECRLSGTEYYGILNAKGTQGKPDSEGRA